MFYLKWKSEDGWATAVYTNQTEALEMYDLYAEVYRFVTLTREESVTTTEMIRDSSAG